MNLINSLHKIPETLRKNFQPISSIRKLDYAKLAPNSISFEQSQRVYPNTHCSGIGKSKGMQWVLSDATVCSPIGAERTL